MEEGVHGGEVRAQELEGAPRGLRRVLQAVCARRRPQERRLSQLPGPSQEVRARLERGGARQGARRRARLRREHTGGRQDRRRGHARPGGQVPQRQGEGARQSHRDHHDVHRGGEARDRARGAHQRPREQAAEDRASVRGDLAARHRRLRLQDGAHQADHQVRAQAARGPRQECARRGQAARRRDVQVGGRGHHAPAPGPQARAHAGARGRVQERHTERREAAPDALLALPAGPQGQDGGRTRAARRRRRRRRGWRWRRRRRRQRLGRQPGRRECRSVRSHGSGGHHVQVAQGFQGEAGGEKVARAQRGARHSARLAAEESAPRHHRLLRARQRLEKGEFFESLELGRFSVFFFF